MKDEKNFVGWGTLLVEISVDLLVIVVSLVVVSVMTFLLIDVFMSEAMTVFSFIVLVSTMVFGGFFFTLGLTGMQRNWTVNMFLLNLDKKGYPFLYKSTYGWGATPIPDENWTSLSREQLRYIIETVPKDHVVERLAKQYLDTFDERSFRIVKTS